jgi:adenylate kinase family enzyme
MEDIHHYKKKIILLLFPPIINNFDFDNTEDVDFIEPSIVNKKLLYKDRINYNISKENIEDIFDENNNNIEEIRKGLFSDEIQNNDSDNKFVIVNFPYSKDDIDKSIESIEKYNFKVSGVILLRMSNYELVEELLNEYLICPFCGKIFDKKTEEKNISCEKDKEYKFLFKHLESFSKKIVEYHFSNVSRLINSLIEKKIDLFQITISEKEEITSGEIKEKILGYVEEI